MHASLTEKLSQCLRGPVSRRPRQRLGSPPGLTGAAVTDGPGISLGLPSARPEWRRSLDTFSWPLRHVYYLIAKCPPRPLPFSQTAWGFSLLCLEGPAVSSPFVRNVAPKHFLPPYSSARDPPNGGLAEAERRFLT